MRLHANITARHRRKRGDGGFTIAELLIVVAIVGVLVAVAIPVFTASLESAKEGTCMANRRSMYAEVVTTAMNSEKTEAEVFAEFDPKRDALGYTCPDNGTWTWNDATRAITCDEHPGEGGTNADEGMFSGILDLFGDKQWHEIIGSDGGQLKTDTGARKEYAKKNGLDTWPEVLSTDGKPYYLQFKSYDKGTSSTFLYAGTNPDPMADSGLWVARYICDSQGLCGEKGTWYELPSDTGLWQNDAASCAEVIKKGTPVKLVGNKFEAA